MDFCRFHCVLLLLFLFLLLWLLLLRTWRAFAAPFALQSDGLHMTEYSLVHSRFREGNSKERKPKNLGSKSIRKL